jgi:UDP-N-acetyl-2-amino-2-deoxyglucuronate dehydrogenase
MSELKAAVIGTGGAAGLHMRAYAGCAHTRPVAVCSRGRKRAEDFAAEFGVRAYTSIEELLEREGPDVVSVATLEWDHEWPVLLSLEAGCHVLCEKIMAHEIAIGERMVAAARRAGRSLGVNFNYRFVPSHHLIKDELDRGGFGAPGIFSAHMHAYLWPHLLDLLRFFFGDPVEVTGAMVDDQALRPPVSAGPSGRPWEFSGDGEMLCHPSVAVSASFRFRNPDFVATMSGSTFVPLERNFWSFALYGDKGAVVIDRATRANLNGVASLGTIAERIATMPACSYAESFELSVGGFVESVRMGRAAPVTGEDGLAEMRLDAAVVEAVRTGRAVGFRR